MGFSGFNLLNPRVCVDECERSPERGVEERTAGVIRRGNLKNVDHRSNVGV